MKKLLKKQLTQAFTLIEVLISLVIISILVGIVFAMYTSIIRLSVRMEQEKNLNNELLFAVQSIQNMVDNYDLDLWYYFTWSTRRSIDEKGYTSVLALKNADKQILLRKQGECGVWTWCFLALEDNGVVKQLTNPLKVSLPTLQFRVLPYQFWSVDQIYQKWFWVYGTITSSRYNSGKYELNVAQDLQLFFNIRKY